MGLLWMRWHGCDFITEVSFLLACLREGCWVLDIRHGMAWELRFDLRENE